MLGFKTFFQFKSWTFKWRLVLASLFGLLSWWFVKTEVWAQDMGLDELGNTANLGNKPLIETIGSVINIGLAIIGVVFFLLIVYGGYMWLSSAGNEEKIAKAKKILINAGIGIAIVLASFAIASFVISKLTDATGNGNGGGGGGYCADCVGLGGGFKVSSVKPRDTETKVKLCCSVQSIFNYNLSTNSVNQNTVKIYDTKNTSDVSDDELVNGSYNVSDKSFSFRHPDFEQDRQYRVVIAGGNSGVLSLNTQYATLKSDKSWVFTTGNETDAILPYVVDAYPTPNSTEACLRSAIQVKFSEEMDTTTLNRNNILIKDEAGQQLEIDDVTPGSDAESVTVYTKDDLVKNTKYTVTLVSGDNGITDNCGNPLDGNKNNQKDGTPGDDYSWSFTTGEEVECRPVLDSITPTSGYYFESRLNGTVMALTGRNLGITGEVMFNDSPADAASFDNTNNTICWNDLTCGVNKVRVKVPVGFALGETNTAEVQFKIGREKSNSLEFNLLSPYIDQLSPKNGAPGQFVTIIGQNFGDTAGQVKIGDKLAEMACGQTSWSDTEIVIKVPEGFDLGETYIQVIKNDSDKHPSNGSSFTVDNSPVGPGLCLMEPSCADTGGGLISKLGGVNFGSSRGSNFVKIGSDKTDSPASWSDTEITNVPVSASLNQGRYLVKVNVNNIDSNGKKYSLPCSQLIRPKVVEDNQCINDLQSPSPTKASSNVCKNSSVVARFTELMQASTLIPSNIIITKCGNANQFDTNLCVETVNVNNIEIISDEASSEAIGFKANLSSDMQSGYWYQATIKAAVTAVSGTPLSQDYTWYWRVKTGSCAIDKVMVSPSTAYLRNIGDTKEYNASALADNCNVLNLNSLKWDWQSSDQTKATIQAIGTSNIAIASALDYTNSSPVKVTANLSSENKQASGNLYISATACQKAQDCRACGSGVSQCVSGNCSPVITKFTPLDGNIGTWVTINGCYFGSDKGQVLYKNSGGQEISGVWPDATMCGSTWSNTQIISEVPSSAATDKFKVDRNSSNPGSVLSKQNFTISSNNYPGLCRLEPAFHGQTQVTSGSAIVKLYGKGLGETRGSGQVNFIKNGATLAKSYNSWSDKSIEAQVPTNLSVGVSQVSVQQSGLYSNRLNYEVKTEGISQAPEVSSISPDSGMVKAGLATTYISIMGTGFGGSKSDSRVMVRAKADTAHWQSTYDFDANRTINSQDLSLLSTNKGLAITGESDLNKKYDLNNDNKVDEADITILTNFLKNYPSEHQIGFEAEATTDCQWSDNLVVAKLPTVMSQGEAWDVLVKTKNGMNSESVPIFTVNNIIHPAICTINPKAGQSGDKIIIKGDNFGDTRKDSQVSFAQNGGGRINSSDGEYKSWSNTSIETIVHQDSLPVNRVVTGPVMVTVGFPATYGGNQSSNPVIFSLQPVITSLSPNKGTTGTWLTVKGSDFTDCGSRGSSTTGSCVVTFAGTNGRILEAPLPAICGNTWSDNQIITKVPTGAKTGLVKVRTKDNVETSDSNSQTFNYDEFSPLTPGLCVLNPSRVSDLPTSVTLKGEGFGDTAQSKDFVQFSNIKFPDRSKTPAVPMFNSWNNGQITLTAPEDTVDGDVSVVLERNLQTGTKCSEAEVNGQCLGIKEPVYSDITVVSNSLNFQASGKYKVLSVKPTSGESNVCRNVAISVIFSKSLQAKLPMASDEFKVTNVCLTGTIKTTVVSYWQSFKQWIGRQFNIGQLAKAQTSSCEEKSVAGQLILAGDKKIIFIPSAPLSGNTTYRVSLPNNKIECPGMSNCQWTFKTRQDICLTDKVELMPTQHTFTKVGATGSQDFYARALTSDGQEVSAQYTWSKTDSQNIFTLVKNDLQPTQANIMVGNAKNGTALISVKADIASFFADGSTNPVAGKCNSGYGFIDRNNNKVIDAGECIKSNYYSEGLSNIDSYICDFPWVAEIDGYNSRLRYCRGNLSSIKQVPVSNLLNGDFENSLNSWNNVSNLWQVVTSPVKSGTTAIVNTHGTGQLKQTVNNLEVNTTYLLKGYVRYNGVLLVNLGGEQITIGGNSNGVWESFNLVTTTDTKTLDITLSSVAGTVYVDNLSLVKATGILPNLTHPPVTAGSGDLLRDYLFKVLGSSEAIGLRIYKNDNRLSPRDWYNARGDTVKGTPKSVKDIDGYTAMQDGKTVYVGAANKSGSNIYSNIYLLSISKIDDEDTAAIFNSLLSDWKFNTNLSDVEQDGLQRDLLRLNDLATIWQLLSNYSDNNDGELPKLAAGSFLPGQSVSTWPSWQSALGNDLGRALPVDPLNSYNTNQALTCQAPDFDQTTCWNNQTQAYECPEGSHVYMYKLGTLNSYNLYMNFETKSVTWVGPTADRTISIGAGDSCNAFNYSSASQLIKPLDAVQ